MMASFDNRKIGMASTNHSLTVIKEMSHKSRQINISLNSSMPNHPEKQSVKQKTRESIVHSLENLVKTEELGEQLVALSSA